MVERGRNEINEIDVKKGKKYFAATVLIIK